MIRDVVVKSYSDTGYVRGKLTEYGILIGYVTFRPKGNGIRDTWTPPLFYRVFLILSHFA